MERFFKLLKAINRKEQVSQRELADQTGLSVGSVNALLREAEERGLLVGQKEGKKARYLLTEDGRGLLETMLRDRHQTKLTLPSTTKAVQTAVILAAWPRPGIDGPASLLPIDDGTVIDRMLQVLDACGIKRYVVVTGYQGDQIRSHLSNRQNVTFVEDARYKWSGSMYGLSLARQLIEDDFLLLNSDIVFEQRAISELLSDTHSFASVITEAGGRRDETLVELDADGNIFRISKDIHQINKIQGELVGICKISKEIYGRMLDYFAENQNPHLSYEYVLENVGRVYNFAAVPIDDLVWSRIDDVEAYHNLRSRVYQRIRRKELQMREKLASDTLTEIMQIDPQDIDEVSFAGGLTNHNYFVLVKGEKYILRLPGRMTESLIDRENEKRNAQIASDLGLNCKLLYCNAESGVKLSAYIEGAETLHARTVKLEENIRLAADILRRLHNSGVEFENDFDPFEESKKYESLLEGSKTYDGFSALRLKVYALLRARLEELGRERRSCHCDLVAENLVKDTDGRLYLIDWEYSGMNDPMFDIAALFLENEFAPEDEELFFQYYFHEDVDLAVCREKILIFKIVQDFLWSIWTLVKEEKGDDYGSYGVDRFRRALQNMTVWENYQG